MLALCLMLSVTYYAQNYAGIIGCMLPILKTLLKRYPQFLTDCIFGILCVRMATDIVAHIHGYGSMPFHSILEVQCTLSSYRFKYGHGF